MTKQPEVLNSVSVFVDGIGFIASTASVELPKIEFEQFESKSGVSTNKIATSVLKAMEAKFELNETNRVYFLELARRFGTYATVWVKANTVIDGHERKIVATLRGTVDNFEFFKPELGKETKSSFTMNVRFFNYVQDGEPLVLVDVDNMICALAGVDIWANQRQFLQG